MKTKLKNVGWVDIKKNHRMVGKKEGSGGEIDCQEQE